uniref:Kinase n=1 Tax=Micromonospora sp. HK160111 TaxID=1245497 RepID=A0A2H4RBX6_9ACTN|nr:kinase [Micromonospora sp. HK160111]
MERDPSFRHETVVSWPAPGTAEADLAVLAGHVREVRDRWPEPVTSVGVALPATVDDAGRVLTWPSRPGWTGVDVGSVMRDLFPRARVTWADDGELAALAEADVAEATDLLYVGVGTGIGGGLVWQGRLVPGLDRGSCELGHVVVDRSGRVCVCGRRGCVQAYASGPAVLRAAATLRRAPVDAAALHDGLGRRAPWAVAAVDDGGAALAVAITSVSELVRPAAVVIGGGFAAATAGYVPTVARHVRDLSRPGTPAPEVRAATLGGLSSLHGAVLLARRT